ncbi:tRNA pseudouridine synthase A [subsurface metagenome]
MPCRNIKTTLAYDGTDFSGWQVQKDNRTVQGVMEDVLKTLHGHPVRIQGAGRTDSGVHASGQVANFHTDLDSIPDFKFCDALNALLPQDVRVLASRQVAGSFNAKTRAVMRFYKYYLYVAQVGLPHYRRYCWKIRQRPDLESLNRIASRLVGEHDFSTFSAAGDSSKSKVRLIYSAAFYPEAPFLVFRIAASSFLWKMVRSVVGTILEIAQKGLGSEEMERIINAIDRSCAGTTAPARGLFLERILYEQAIYPC